MEIETTILENLLSNEEFTRKAIPFLESDYFAEYSNRVTFELIKSFLDKYNEIPTKEILLLDLNNKKDISEDQFKLIGNTIGELQLNKKPLEWILEETEKYCKRRAIVNAISESIQILEEKSKDKSEGQIPDLLSKALAVSFDTAIGHDFFEDSDERYELYHQQYRKIPFDIDLLNKITKGGLRPKTLNVLMAGTGVGKTALMCHMAAANLAAGSNVLYITLEMAAADGIGQRIDANLLDITLEELDELPKDSFDKKLKRVKDKTKGKLIIKEYPSGQANANHFRHLLHELKTKKKFVPDIIYIDYINLCSSSKIKMGNSVNTYVFIKAIAEEIRALAQENDLPIVSATQSNREGNVSSDVGIDNVSESFGLAHTVDLLLVIISLEELELLGQLLFKQLKNRYNDINYYKKFVVGIDRSKMKLYNLEDSAQKDLTISKKSNSIKSNQPVMDVSDFGERDKEASEMKFTTRKAGKRDFSGVHWA